MTICEALEVLKMDSVPYKGPIHESRETVTYIPVVSKERVQEAENVVLRAARAGVLTNLTAFASLISIRCAGLVTITSPHIPLRSLV